jgi:hypothetical protein
MAYEFVNLVDVPEHEVPDFPRKRNELLFSLVMEKMQLVVLFPCYFCNKHLVCNVTWKERRIFLGAKNHYYTIIFLVQVSPSYPKTWLPGQTSEEHPFLIINL